MAELLLGPLLRYVGDECAVFWVETDEPCEVDVLGARRVTFKAEGHHYALVRAEGLEPATSYEYEVLLDGQRAWPLEDSEFPPSRFETLGGDTADDPLTIAFGSCRVAAPSEPPYNLTKDEDDRGREHDALRTLALRMRTQQPDEWPDLLVLLGDQVYADECSPRTKEFIRARRDTEEEPGPIALDFEEYTQLYRESWGEPVIRWLLSTVSTAMIFDDHDVHDDWNASDAWLQEMRATDWWDEHIIGALSSYWIYQHAGNLSPEEQDADGLLARVQEAGDAGEILREFACGADRERGGSRWSYHRDIGRTRLVMIDSRAGRVLEEGKRSMLDEGEWKWIEEHATGGFDHLLLATSLPWLLAPAMHHLEAWNEAVCGGAWGAGPAKAGEWLRQELDLEHWAAFNESFERLAELQRAVGAGERGEPPASIVTLSGDVHHAYLSEVAFRREAGVRTPVYQAVCSPMRNPLDSQRAARHQRRSRLGRCWPPRARCRGRPGSRTPRCAGGWSDQGPWFDNQVATLRIDGRRIDMQIEKALAQNGSEPELECVMDHRLA